MQWQVGQRLICDRPEQLLAGCTIVAKDGNSVVISCPAAGIVVTGEQRRLEELGWQADLSHNAKDHDVKDHDVKDRNIKDYGSQGSFSGSDYRNQF